MIFFINLTKSNDDKNLINEYIKLVLRRIS